MDNQPNQIKVKVATTVYSRSTLTMCNKPPPSLLGPLLVVLLLFSSIPLLARAAPGDTCLRDGTSYSYTESVSGDTRLVTSNLCPNHYFDMGTLNPNFAIEGDKTFSMPSSPMLESTANSPTDWLSSQGGGIGILFNSAYIYSAYAGPGTTLTNYASSATALEGDTFDKCGCHSSSNSKAGYHCHIPPSCLLHQLGETAVDHSPQIGWSPDGFPVYGPRTVGGLLIKLCTEPTNTDSTYCMDECSGLEMELPTVDNFKYRYHFSGEDYLEGTHADPRDGIDPISPLSTAPYFPFTSMCLKGCCPSGATCSGTTATVPVCSSDATSGVASGYTAAAMYPTGLAVYGDNSGSDNAQQTCEAANPDVTLPPGKTWNTYTYSCRQTGGQCYSSSSESGCPTNWDWRPTGYCGVR